MNPLANLRENLAATNARAFRGLVPERTGLEREVQKLKAWLGSAGTVKPPANLVREAVARFHQTLTTRSLRDTRLVCYGFTEAFDAGRSRLVEDGRRFPALLDVVEGYRGEPRRFRRCFKGLLNGYFSYDGSLGGAAADGKQNWEKLRSYLHGRIADLRGEGTLPDWVQALGEHANLTTESPCDRYAVSFLNGDEEEFEEVRSRLDISGASWITTRLVLSQVVAAAEAPDREFVDYLPLLLSLLRKHEILVNQGLARILDRYREVSGAAIHAELRDFSIGRWGTPWLTSNSARWSQVSRETKQMVEGWLKLELIHDFFELLAEDGSSDRRRLKFWQRYHQHIDDMYFALGSRAARNQSADFRSLRSKMQGRLLGLDSGGPADNNAFIMCMGEYVVVEFGIKGNACFIFRRDSLPFQLERTVAGDTTALKHPENVARLLHIDRSDQSWEKIFESSLGELASVRPRAPRGVNVERGGRAVQPTARPNATRQDDARDRYETVDLDYSRLKLERFCAARSLRVRDLTSKGGSLWIEAGNTDSRVSRQLQAWQFRYKQGRGWWRRSG